MAKKTNVFVGMSGGIDSSVAAFLLKRDGHSVTGITFTAADEQGSKKCCSLEEIQSAKKVCEFLKIPHRVVDLKDIFEAKVIQYFISNYRKGLTPNPCVLCNRFIKFGALLEYSLSEGADYLATGHYAGITCPKPGECYIRKGKDRKKDQSYFLSMIEKDKLQRILLPIGQYEKPEVRAIAVREKMPIHPNKSESQDVCFIRDDYRNFLIARGVPEEPGDFLLKGKTAGRHRGIPFYSYGQRRGLSVAAGERVFVREFEFARNRIILGEKPMAREFTAGKINRFKNNISNEDLTVQVRYQSEALKAKIEFSGNEMKITLDKPFEIVTPGQFAVVYEGDIVAAAGEIVRVSLIQ